MRITREKRIDRKDNAISIKAYRDITGIERWQRRSGSATSAAINWNFTAFLLLEGAGYRIIL
jgi:hypothetical protein